MQASTGRYIMLISVHGLIRGENLELGRDADTGGQTTYVVELARHLSRHENVDRVDLVTRLVQDGRVSEDYARPIEELAPNCRIVRIRCGPNRYIAKEKLWPHLDSFVDNTLQYIRGQGWAPDLIHGHYADAGYVASQLSGILNIPMAFTGHSLGRVKRARLSAQGVKSETIERRYNIGRRIAAEETAIDNAAFVVASTNQEVEEQYAQYDYYQPRRMIVIPPGVDLSRFSPPGRSGWRQAPIFKEITPFLSDWGKPMILALSRPDHRKNIATLVKAYGENDELRELANLVIVAGNRDDIRELDKGAREVLTEVLMLIDKYNLYGSAAYPKHHSAEDVPELYRLAAKTKGVFVNPALTEPFGLTLIEAAASGLPIVATRDGGPRDITAACKNGILVDPADQAAIGEALLHAIRDPQRWRKWSRNGIRGAHKHFSWPGHVEKYMRAARTALSLYGRRRVVYSRKSRLITADRFLITDVDNTLTGDRDALNRLIETLHDAGESVGFGIATGRNMAKTEQVLKEWKVPTPQVVITSVGSVIHYGPHLVEDMGWEQHIAYRWQPDAIRAALEGFPGIRLQAEEFQDRYKISYDLDPEKMPRLRELVRYLRRARLQCKLIYSHGAYLDCLPIRASKGTALRYFANKWNIPLEHMLVAGESGNDIEMLTGNTLAVVVGNYDPELEQLRGEPRIYFAEGRHAAGVLEGIEHYNFLGKIRVPETETAGI